MILFVKNISVYKNGCKLKRILHVINVFLHCEMLYVLTPKAKNEVICLAIRNILLLLVCDNVYLPELTHLLLFTSLVYDYTTFLDL